MARIRTIKPEFPKSESVGHLSREARLLFIQLWTMVDDHGRCRAAPRLIACELYPYDLDAPDLVPRWLDELQRRGFIRLYKVEGNSYLDIPTWSKHQRIDNAGKSHIPEFCGDSPRAAATDGEPPLDLGPRTIGKDLGPSLSEHSSDDQPSKKSSKENSKKRNDYPIEFEKEFWSPYPTDQNMSKKEAFDAWKRLSPDDRELAARAVPAFRRYCESNPDYRPIHACRFLLKRRFEGFATPSAANGPPAGLSPEERAKWVRQQMEAENAANAA